MRVSAIFRNPTPRMQARLLAGDERAAAPRVFEPWPVSYDVRVERRRAAHVDERRVLLTGANGFVGAHLLASFLLHTDRTLVCVVRARSEQEARSKLSSAARGHGIELSPFSGRIEVLPLDLSAPEASAALLVQRVEPCAMVFHCAAQVSLVRDYRSLAPVNVLATRHLLEACAHWAASFHHVSSLATVPSHAPAAAPEQLFPMHAGLCDGYQQSKWHAEALCGEAGALGVPVAVYRLGRVTAPQKRPNIQAADLVWRIARTATRIASWPDLPFAEPWIRADEASDMMTQLALRGSASAPASVYHLVHDESVRLPDFCTALVDTGFALEVVPVPEWVARARALGDDEALSTLSFFELHERSAGPLSSERFSRANVEARLRDLTLSPFDGEALRALCRHARDTGFLEAPRAGSSVQARMTKA